MVPDARRRRARRRRLPLPRRPDRRRHRAWRREPLPGRDRGGPAGASGGRRLRGRRRRGRAVGRGRGRGDRAARRPHGQRGRAPRLGEGPPAVVARAGTRRVPERAPVQRDREALAPEAPRRAGAGVVTREVEVTAARVTLPELVGRLLAPQADAPSALGGTPVVAVEVAAGERVAPAALAAAAARMATLACPSIALAPEAPPAELRAFVAACDVVVA